MPFHTPLRYPGGKRRLSSLVKLLLETNGFRDIDYVEPFAGGASIALTLLFEEFASTAHINDLSRPVFAFWKTALDDPVELCHRIEKTPVTMEEWYRQRAIYEGAEEADLFDLGFATFFLNRTNRSGIISGGVIGGKKQDGPWKLDARFNKKELIRRIERIGRYSPRISLSNADASDFVEQKSTELTGQALFFIDPPYISRGTDLYLDNYSSDDHKRLEQDIVSIPHPWLLTYDYDAAVDLELYRDCTRISFALSYSAQKRQAGREVMYMASSVKVPRSWHDGDLFSISSNSSQHPVFATLEQYMYTPS